ncbi:50S ribosomal protein L4 [bacterium DOLZORAL124_38_8]|nr:MAG: 50S ribosomal protein L4 [bacterium DOLZORAL124_38_8]
MKIDLFAIDGTKKQKAVSADLFEANINEDLMHRAVLMRLANRRNAIAHVQARGDVSATRKKAFRQKGTGNARRGSLTTNLLRGGGAVHAPRNVRNFAKDMPKKERRAALFSSLSLQAQQSNVFALEKMNMEAPKTKEFVAVLDKLPEAKKYLFVFADKDENLRKSMNNLPNVKTILASYLNPFDVLHAEKVCFFEDALAKTEEVFLSHKK